MAEVASAYVSLVPSARGFGRQMEGQIGSEIQQGGKSLGGKLMGGLKVAGVGAAAAVGGLLATALTKGFGRLNAIDQAKAKLSGLGNSAKTVDVIMANALSSVKGTAFGLDEAATTAASAVAAGIKPGKQLTGVLKTVADTATIAGASMADTGAIFGSVAARGKLQGDDLMQLQSRGVPVLAFLAKHYGITAQAASKMVSKGQVDFKNFNAAMQENLGGAALKSGETFTGAFANLKASLGRIGANLLSGIFPQVKVGLGKLTALFGKIEPLATKVGEWIGKGVAQIGPLISSVVAAVGPFVDRIKAAFSSLTQGGGLSSLGTTITTQVLPAVQSFGAFITGTLIPALTSVGSYIAANVVPILVRIGQVIATQVVPIVLAFAQFLYGTLYPAVVAIATSIGSKLKPVLDAVFAAISTQVLPVVQQLLAKFREWQPTIQAVIAVVVAIIGKVLEFAAAILGKVLPPLIRFAAFLLVNVVKAVVAVIEVVARIIGKAIAFGVAIFNAGQKAVEFAKTVRQKMLDVLGYIGDIPGKVKGYFADAGKWLLNAGKEIIGGLIKGITGKIDDIGGAMSKVASKIKGFLPGSPVKEGPLTSWNRGGAGKRLVSLLAVGLSDTAELDRAMTGLTSRIAVAPMSVPVSMSGSSAGAVPRLRLHPDGMRFLAQLTGRSTGSAIVDRGRGVQLDARNTVAR